MGSKRQINKWSKARQVGLKVLGDGRVDLSKTEAGENITDINQDIQNTFKDNPYQYTRGDSF